MRVFLLFILAANFGYYAWLQGWTGDLLPQAAKNEFEPPVQPGFEQVENRLMLLSELSTDLQESENMLDVEILQISGSEEPVTLVVPALETAPVEVAVEPWCGIVRGFGEESLARQFQEGMDPVIGSADLGMYEVAVSSTWWVHIPAFESEAVALAMLGELQDNNIDSYYMRTGELRGGISLGVFRRQESALTAQNQFARLGYATSIAEVFRMEDRFELIVRLQDRTALESPEWLALIAISDGLELAENSCETIAHTPQFP